MATKSYPDTTLQQKLGEQGVSCRLQWEMRGPKDTLVAWLSCYLVNGYLVIVETYKDNCGWEAFTPSGSIKIDETVADVIARCRKPTDPDEEQPQPVDTGACDPLYGQRMDSADLGEC